MSSSTTTTPTPIPSPTPVVIASTVETAVTDARKAVENEAKAHMNTIWQKLENVAEWPVEKIEALIADLKKHV